MSQLPAACAACDEHLISLAFEEHASVPPECVTHAKTCPRCAAELAALKDTRGLAALPMDEPSEAMDTRILAALDEHLASAPAQSRTPGLTVLPGGASSPKDASAPIARRAWRGPIAAAASVAVIAGGVLMLSEGTRLARRGVPAAQLAAQTLAPAPVKAPDDAARPLELADKALERPAGVQKAVPPASAGEAAAPAPTDSARTKARREAPVKARQDQAPPPPAANTYEAPARKQEAAVEIASPAPAEKKSLEAAPAPVAPKPSPPAPDLAAQKKERVAEAETLAMEDRDATHGVAPRRLIAEAETLAVDDLDALGAAPTMPSGLGGLSTRSVPVGRAEARAVDHGRLLAQADAAAARGDYRQASGLYARVANDRSAPHQQVVRALEGQARSLLALGRFDEAAAAAHRLSVMAPGAPRLKEEIERARVRALEADSK